MYYDPSRDPKELVSSIGEKTDRGVSGLDYPGWDTSGFYLSAAGRSDPLIQMGDNLRTFPSTLPDVRTHDLRLLDIGLFKTFSLPRDVQLGLWLIS